MNGKETRAKRAAIRQEIKERMQRELDECRKEIKERIRREDIPIEEKREKYRREVHEQKLRLMELARAEFRARKRMLGRVPEEDVYEEPLETPPSGAPSTHEEDQSPQGEAGLIEPRPYVPMEDVFVYKDEEEADALREFERPIDEYDAVPFGMERLGDEAGAEAKPEERVEKPPEVKNLIYHIFNLIFHPVQTLDEFENYLTSPSRFGKVILFYFVSLLAVVVFVLLVAQGIAEHLPGGIVGSVIGSGVLGQAGVVMVVGWTVLNLLIYSLIIATVNYLVRDEANLITLIVYFAFIEAVTRVVTHTLTILAGAAVAAIGAPQLLVPIGAGVGLLFLAYIFWTIALDIIVLMRVYGYGRFGAITLTIGAWIVKAIFMSVIETQLGIWVF